MELMLKKRTKEVEFIIYCLTTPIIKRIVEFTTRMLIFVNQIFSKGKKLIFFLNYSKTIKMASNFLAK